MADITKRVNYFDHQFLRAQDFLDEQAYHMDRRRRQNQLLHTPGVEEGLDVTGDVGSTTVNVSPGVAIDAQGREIVLPGSSDLVLPTGESSVSIYISYHEGESASDMSTEPGADGKSTRIEESPALEARSSSSDPPLNAVLLAEVALDRSGHIAIKPDNGVRSIASARIKNLAVTEAMLANDAVTNEKINDSTIDEAKFNPSTRQKLNAGIRGWVRLPFFPKGIVGMNEFQIKPASTVVSSQRAGSSDLGTGGSIGIPIPAGANYLHNFRIIGNQQPGGSITIILVASLGDRGEQRQLLSEEISDTAFNLSYSISFPGGQNLNAETDCIGLTVITGNASNIHSIAAEFEIVT